MGKIQKDQGSTPQIHHVLLILSHPSFVYLLFQRLLSNAFFSFGFCFWGIISKLIWFKEI
jgi:hypothetical protein